MSTTSTKDKKFTQKLMSSPRTALFVAGLLALVVDTAAMVAFSALGVKMALCYVILSLMLALDAVFLFEILLSNFRLPYAKHTFWGHVALLALLSAGNIWLSTLIADGKVFTTLAMIAWCAVHLAICIGYIICVAKASRGRTGSGTASGVAALVVIVATIAYAALLVSIGFFGQGAPPRTLVYTLNENGTYTVSGVLDGRGREVIVPNTFDGAPVAGIDCSIFGANGVTSITLEVESEDIELTNTDALADINDGLAFYVHKNNATIVRDTLYEEAAKTVNEAEVFELANRITPCGLDEDEVFVTVSYDAATYAQVKEHTIPIWIANAGTTFNPSVFANNDEDLTYATYTNTTNGAELKWCVEKMGGYQFSGFNADGTSIVDTKINKSIEGITVSFHKVYTLTYAGTNDAPFSFPKDFTNSLVGENEYDNNYYITLENAETYLASAPTRSGFSLKWLENGTNEVTDLSGLLANKANHLEPVKLKAEWKMDAPSIGTLSYVGSEGANLIYGHDVIFSTSGVTHGADVVYDYTWKDADGKEIASASAIGVTEIGALSMSKIKPEESGTYTLSVTAYNTDITILEATAEATIDISVSKRTLGFTWTLPLPENRVYSADDKTIVANYNVADALPGDVITFTQDLTTVRNAGSYTASVALTGETDAHYTIAPGDVSSSFDIEPYTTQVVWMDLETTYNGSVQAPTVEAATLGGDDLGLTLSLVNLVNAGSYDMVVSTANPNYTLTNNTETFIIKQKVITATWSTTNSFTYNGQNQSVVLASLSGCIGNEAADVLGSIIYTGIKKNVGTYSITATLPASSNYKFEGEVSSSYTIEKKELTVNHWGTTLFTYNGGEQVAKIASLSGTVAGEDASILATMLYSGAAINCGDSYVSVAQLPEDSNYYFAGTVSQTYKIQQKIVTPKWGTTLFTYNGTTHTVTVTELEGIVNKDTDNGMDDLVYANNSQKNAGTYTASLTLDNNSNYRFETDEATVSYTIQQKQISATWSPVALTYNGGVQSVIVTTLTGCVEGEQNTVLASITYAGNEMQNAGSYTATATLPSDSNYKFAGGASVSKSYNIAKYTLSPVWTTNAFTYDGTEKSVFVDTFESYIALELTEVLNSLSYSSNTQKNAGTYTATIALPQNSNYQLSSNSCTYTIAKRALTPTWGTTTFTYDGATHTVTLVDLAGCVDVESAILATITYTGNIQKNAGTYTATATLPANSNYVFESTVSTAYTIEKRAISLTWDNTTFTYNGSEQYPKAASIVNVVSGEEAAVKASITYSGKGKNAGFYTVTAALPATSNYVFEDLVTADYTIEKKLLTNPVWGTTNLTYNASQQTVKVTDITGCASGEKTSVLNSLIYIGNAETNAGTYTATTTLPDNSNYYCDEVITTTFTIAKKEISAGWGSASFTYDGAEHTVKITSLSGVAASDKDAVLASIIHSDNYATMAGTYTATAELPDDSNYVLKAASATKTFEIKKKSISLTWATTTFTYNGESQTMEVSKVNGTAIGEDTMVLNSLIFANESQINAGTYTVTVSLPDDGNYQFSTGVYSTTKSYTIGKRTLTATWNPLTNTISSLSGCVSGEEAEVLASITYTGHNETDPGTYTATATLPNNSNYKFASGASTTYSYTIQPPVTEEPEIEEEV